MNPKIYYSDYFILIVTAAPAAAAAANHLNLHQVDDQMNLLQHSWSDILLLDHIHQRMHNNLADEMQLPNGQQFDLLTLALLGVSSAADQLHSLTMKLAELKFDTIDYTCLKFLLLLNPGEYH